MTERPPKLALRFSWETVDANLVRELLRATYEATEQPEEIQRLADASDDVLRRTAARALGSPPKSAHLNKLTDALRNSWLPALDPSLLRDLARRIQDGVTGQAQHTKLTSKWDCLEFLRERRKTANFKAQLSRAFVQSHRQRLPVRAGSSGSLGKRELDFQEIRGEMQPDPRTPFPHQVRLWKELDALSSKRGSRAGLIVLPTGAGKTYTAVHWLLEQMRGRPELRVLWLADRQELVDQAASTFAQLGACQPKHFVRRMRRMHGAANLSSSIADADLDIAVVTRQSIISTYGGIGRGRLKSLLSRPTIVVVDEAHHAIAPTYEHLLADVTQAEGSMLLGLTATPWPAGYGAIAKLRTLFPVSLGEVGHGELISAGVLARPVFTTVQTNETISLTPDELKSVGGDLPPSALRRLDRQARNSLIVDAWVQRQNEWGKTLVFAVDIEHAESLGDAFRDKDIAPLVVHSRIDEAPRNVLSSFRKAKDPCILISVGMLTEGVDIPDARTVFLARPTQSRILMRQMIGRVLRGPAGGGDPVAHVVDVRDRWVDQIDILSPIEIPGVSGVVESSGDKRVHRYPGVVDELTDKPIPEDVLRGVMRQVRERTIGTPIDANLTSSILVGFYELDLISVPVFEHARDRWDFLVARTLKGRDLGVRSPIQLFGDLPIPRPTPYEVRVILEHLEVQQVAPPLREVRTVFSVRAVAKELMAVDAMTAQKRTEWILDRFERTLARSTFSSLQSFHEAVDREVLVLAAPSNVPTFNPEDVDDVAVVKGSLPKLRRAPDRQLEPLLRQVANLGRELLADEPEYVERLLSDELPSVLWTDTPRRGSWAYWTPRISHKGKGQSGIRVNVSLRASSSKISDELLKFLLWHEMCHHLTPNQGHDAEFRRLEAIWPNAPELDHALDNLVTSFDFAN